MISISGKCLFGRLSARDIKAIEDTIQEMDSVSDSFPRTVDLSRQRAFFCKLVQPESRKEHSGVFCELSVIYGHSGMGLHTDAQKKLTAGLPAIFGFCGMQPVEYGLVSTFSNQWSDKIVTEASVFLDDGLVSFAADNFPTLCSVKDLGTFTIKKALEHVEEPWKTGELLETFGLRPPMPPVNPGVPLVWTAETKARVSINLLDER